MRGNPASSTLLGSRQVGVYPRVCGGTRLSPEVTTAGSIPACAGEPRLAGGGRRDRTQSGLSPRVRGNPEKKRLRREVYPLVCGGTLEATRRLGTKAGLSPRVRGNPARCDCLRRGAGSIPACAGEPARGVEGHECLRVYPRVCGGTTVWPVVVGSILGLSPRVRGNRRSHWPAFTLSAGSIPACAGEPQNASVPVVCLRVYPRVCGGTKASGLARKTLGSRVYPRVCGGTSCS